MAAKKTFGKSLIDNFFGPLENQDSVPPEKPLKEKQNVPVKPEKKASRPNLKGLSIPYSIEIKRPEVGTSLSVVAFKINKNNKRTEKDQILQKRLHRKEQKKLPENIEDLPIRGGTCPYDKFNFGIVLNSALYDKALARKEEKRLSDNRKWGLATIVRDILENPENWPPWFDNTLPAPPTLPKKIQDGKNLSIYISKDIYLKVIKTADTYKTSVSRICNEIINTYFNDSKE